MKVLMALALMLGTTLFAAEDTAAKQPNVRYRKAKDVNFEALLIQGQMGRGEIAVVTGDAQDGTDGLLRLRENFLDRVAVDGGEEVP